MAGALQNAFRVDSSKKDAPMEFSGKIDPVHLQSFQPAAGSNTAASNPILPETNSHTSSWSKWLVVILLSLLFGIWALATTFAGSDLYNITINSQGGLKIAEAFTPNLDMPFK